jgi:hypothetical protein
MRVRPPAAAPEGGCGEEERGRAERALVTQETFTAYQCPFLPVATIS